MVQMHTQDSCPQFCGKDFSHEKNALKIPSRKIITSNHFHFSDSTTGILFEYIHQRYIPLQLAHGPLKQTTIHKKSKDNSASCNQNAAMSEESSPCTKKRTRLARHPSTELR
jgi:hypothetical protein